MKQCLFNNDYQDGIAEFCINEMKAYWTSFVWNNERILLFTNDTFVAKNTGFVRIYLFCGTMLMFLLEEF